MGNYKCLIHKKIFDSIESFLEHVEKFHPEDHKKIGQLFWIIFSDYLKDYYCEQREMMREEG